MSGVLRDELAAALAGAWRPDRLTAEYATVDAILAHPRVAAALRVLESAMAWYMGDQDEADEDAFWMLVDETVGVLRAVAVEQ